jgi:hypothetical protein
MDPANLVVGVVGVAVSTLQLINNAYHSSTDVRELINESDSLRRAVEAAKLHSDNNLPDLDLQILVQQGTAVLAEAAVLLEDLPPDGTSTTTKILQARRRKRWNEKARTCISTVRLVKFKLMYMMENLYDVSSSLEHLAITNTLQR